MPRAKLVYLEYDADCASEWRSRIEDAGATLYVGDQANQTLLRQIVLQEQVKGLDIIIDDGGHTMDQQLTSLQLLWKLIRPGGVYVIEDLGTSYLEGFGGNPSPKAPSTTMAYVKSLLDSVNCKDSDVQHHSFCQHTAHSLHNILSVHCFSALCAVFKAQI